MGMKNPGGEIVQVQGGHIVRSTGRKDRHSKVFTAKGPRDRRVRLSAHTAIQFYDVQDRLGYDRPSKAVDWLIKKAKSAIDKLDELPPWHPTATATPTPTPDETPDPEVPGSAEMEPGIDPESSGYGFHAIPDSMKPFFPTSSESHHQVQPSLNFQNYPPDHTPADHLGLSLHSFHGGGGGGGGETHHVPVQQQEQEQALFGFGPGGGAYQRMVTWHGDGGDQGRASASSSFGFGGGAAFAAPHGLLGQTAAFGGSNSNQRGTLQSSSSFSQLVKAWDDLPPSMAAAVTSAQHRPQPQPHHHQQIHHHQPSIFGTRFVSDGGGGGGFPVFCIPARIHGEDDVSVGGGGGHGGVVSERPSSSSSPNSAHR